MRRTLTIGLLMFLTGILLEEVSYIAEIWIIRVLGSILWPVGMVMGINALISLKHENNDSHHQLTESDEDK